MTHWAGNAYSKLTSEDYRSYIWRMWEKTGCLMTGDGSEDKKIQPEGLSNYQGHPPILIEPNEAPPCSNFVDPEIKSIIQKRVAHWRYDVFQYCS